MRLHQVLLTLFLLAISWSAQAEICRWVDEDGTVHFTEKCPEGVEGSEVKLDPEPTPEQVRAAQEIYKQRQKGKQARDTAESKPFPESDEQEEDSAELCVDAMLAESTLEQSLPVYFDEAGKLHHGRSRHSQSYQGERHYLNDAERQAELAQTRQLISQHCGESRSDITGQSEEIKTRLKEQLCTDYRAKAERMIRSREGGSAEQARQLIKYCESDRDQM